VWHFLTRTGILLSLCFFCFVSLIFRDTNKTWETKVISVKVAERHFKVTWGLRGGEAGQKSIGQSHFHRMLGGIHALHRYGDLEKNNISVRFELLKECNRRRRTPAEKSPITHVSVVENNGSISVEDGLEGERPVSLPVLQVHVVPLHHE